MNLICKCMFALLFIPSLAHASQTSVSDLLSSAQASVSVLESKVKQDLNLALDHHYSKQEESQTLSGSVCSWAGFMQAQAQLLKALNPGFTYIVKEGPAVGFKLNVDDITKIFVEYVVNCNNLK